eukprot:CAMPEP_0172588322 /NCGR_PEP_ID=MMETSP1068-20121228/7239_1 /TAXON_ID=35684 /ORGANISM="Pseudopedinella elastica, Strain CCMP716" /LENGTH=97 /DNA_ID=CAMNT_0013383611 /DNA_START=375 /DNA_END=665 /DNA_ORIENTATION=+
MSGRLSGRERSAASPPSSSSSSSSFCAAAPCPAPRPASRRAEAPSSLFDSRGPAGWSLSPPGLDLRAPRANPAAKARRAPANAVESPTAWAAAGGAA